MVVSSRSPSILIVMSMNISFLGGDLKVQLKPIVLQMFLKLSQLFAGCKILVMQPEGESIVNKSFVVHEIWANEGDNVVMFIDCNVKICNGWSRWHAHSNSASLAEDQVSKLYTVASHDNIHCFFNRFEIIFIPDFRKEFHNLVDAVIYVYICIHCDGIKSDMLALGGRTSLSISCFNKNESLK